MPWNMWMLVMKVAIIGLAIVLLHLFLRKERGKEPVDRLADVLLMQAKNGISLCVELTKSGKMHIVETRANSGESATRELYGDLFAPLLTMLMKKACADAEETDSGKTWRLRVKRPKSLRGEWRLTLQESKTTFQLEFCG